MSANTLKVYVIKIVAVSKPNIWYRRRVGEIFEATMEKKGSLQMFKVSALTFFYVYPIDAEIIRVKELTKYSRYL